MKTQTITLTHLPDTLLVVLPPNGIEPEIFDDVMDRLYFRTTQANLQGPMVQVDLPQGNWRIVSTLADLTEEDAKGLVKKVISGQHYQNYNYKSVAERWVKTALESFHSAIRASGWLLENLYPDINDPKFYDELYDGSGFYQELYSGALDSWKQRQSRTLNPELTLILERN